MFKKIKEEKIKITFEVEPKLYKKLKQITKKLNTTQRSFIQVAITKLMDEIKDYKIEL